LGEDGDVVLFGGRRESWPQINFPLNLKNKLKTQGETKKKAEILKTTQNSENHTRNSEAHTFPFKKKLNRTKMRQPTAPKQNQHKTATKVPRRAMAFHIESVDFRMNICMQRGSTGKERISKLLAVWMGCDTMLGIHEQGNECSLVHDECRGKITLCRQSW